MANLKLICVVIALVLFFLGAFVGAFWAANNGRYSLVSGGLFFLTLSQLVT